MGRIEFRESPQKTERGAVDAPPRKRKDPRRQQQQRLQSLRLKNNMRLNQHKAERASFGTPRGEETAKQAILTAVHQATDNEGNQPNEKAH